MNILFDIGHPAHVHLFKNFISYLQHKGHSVFVTTRNKEITNQLLDYYKISYECISSPMGKGKLQMLVELMLRDFKLFALHFKHKFYVSFGTSPSIAHLTAVTLGKVKSYNFGEDDDEVVPLHTKITYPFTTRIVVPSCLKYSKWLDKREVHNSYHELAYLHPNNFSPDVKVLEKYSLLPGKYIIARFSSLQAHHDVGAKGIDERLWKNIETLISGYTVIKSIEKSKTHQIEPWDMHHLIAYSKMIISDSQTMTIEGSVLGIPSVRINTFIGKSSLIDELESKYMLAFGIHPSNEEKILATIKNLVSDTNIENTWMERRKQLLADKLDLNEWMINYFETKINLK